MTVGDRVLRRYTPRFDLRTDRLKRGCCGRPWCFEPAVWVWLDAAGKQRHLCKKHGQVSDDAD